MKQCTKCGELKDLNSGFYRQMRSSDGHASICIECNKAWARRRQRQAKQARQKTAEAQARFDYGGATYRINGEVVMRGGKLADSEEARQWWQRVVRAYGTRRRAREEALV